MLPWYGLRVGGYFRWSEPNETNLLDPAPLPGITVHAVQGYEEPFGFPLRNGSVLLVRNERRATATGGTVEFTALATRVVLTHERGKRAEDQYTTFTFVRPTDRWRASGSETRVQLQRMLGSKTRATVLGVSESLDGETMRRDLTGIVFSGSDVRRAVEGDVRIALGNRWSAALLGGATMMRSDRRDFVVSLPSHVDATTPFISGEIARRVGRFALAVGGSAASTSPSGSVPNAAAQQGNYQRLIAPMLAYEVAEARAVAGWLSATTPLRVTTLLVSLRAEKTTPSSVNGARLQPGGERTGWNLSVGIRP
jgi:hypothetical protein